DLERVDRESCHVAQRGVARAEVVELQLDAQRLEAAQRVGRVAVVLKREALGDLQAKRLGLQAAVLQGASDALDERVGLLELAGGDVRAELHVLGEGEAAAPGSDPTAGDGED